MNTQHTLRSRLLWLPPAPPIENAFVVIRDGRIIEFGPWTNDRAHADADAQVQDLGEVALLPGLVNAHCHLDYTDMAGLIPPPKNFPDWIKSILSLKAHWSYTEYAASWLHGVRQLLESGVTAVGDIEAVPELLPDSWESTPLRIVSFIEMTGVRSGGQPERILAEALQQIRRIGSGNTKQTGLSPHALYSTPPELLRLSAELARKENLLTSTHLAESMEELQMYRDREGLLFHWLKTQRPMDDCGHTSPIQVANRLGLLQPGFIAVHCNHLERGDAELLGRNQCSVVHCPRSHDYFQHAPFRFKELSRNGVNLCLATDSLASARLDRGKLPTLNLWQEMQLFALRNPTIEPDRILPLVTTNPARALRLPEDRADLIAIEYSGPATNFPDHLIHTTPTIRQRWINGAPVNS